MNALIPPRLAGARSSASPLRTAPLALGLLALAACASSPAPPAAPPSAPAAAAAPGAARRSADPRVGLRAGWLDAGVAAWNVRLVSTTPPPEDFVGVTNSDLAFTGDYAIQGNYNGFMVWDISNPARPTLALAHLCPASQSDVSVFRNLLFVSGEGLGGRIDCGTQGVPDTVSLERLRGIRVFDVSDMRNPRYIANVQTCRGSHTHTVVTDPDDAENVYIYVSGSASVRSPSELPGCSDGSPEENPNTARFRIEVIRVPLADPTAAAIASSPRIFNDLPAPPRHADPPDTARERRMAERRAAAGQGGDRRRAGPPRPRTGPNQCHDITVYPEIGLAGGACGGYGLLLDISDVANPARIGAVADSNFSYWHSATFSNDGSKVLFTDEWGGGSQPRCRASDKYEWGADAIFTLENRRMRFQSYYKMPAPQTELENCVAHNGSLIPIPGREVMVQGWYQGGISVFDWTDPKNPVEIAFYDRGPMDTGRLVSAGSWSAYWYNGYIYSSEIARGLDVFDLAPSEFLTQNEIDAAKSVRFDYFNAQEQRRIVWPPSFALARAYLDQLERGRGLAAARIAAVRAELARAEALPAAERSDALARLGAQLHGEANAAADAARVHTLAAAVEALGRARP